eukprot:EG_transcript_25731
MAEGTSVDFAAPASTPAEDYYAPAEATSEGYEAPVHMATTASDDFDAPLEMSEEGDDKYPSKDEPIGSLWHPRNWMVYWDQKMKGSALLGSFNIICSVVGVGIFGLPYALSQSGWFGIFLLLLTFVMATFTC